MAQLFWLLPPCSDGSAASAQTVQIPVIVPLTGPIALEGTSQRNGAVLAIESAVPLKVGHHGAGYGRRGGRRGRTPWARSRQQDVVAAVAPMFGTQVLPSDPAGRRIRHSLLASGHAAITEKGSKTSIASSLPTW